MYQQDLYSRVCLYGFSPCGCVSPALSLFHPDQSFVSFSSRFSKMNRTPELLGRDLLKMSFV